MLLFALAEDVFEFSSYIISVSPTVDNAALMSIVGRVHDSAKRAILVLDNLRMATDEEVVEVHNFIVKTLPDTSDQLRSALNKSGEKLYTPIFQKLGDNLRQSGSVIAQEVAPGALLKLPEYIYRVLKLDRMLGRITGQERFYAVVDALRHPFEARYLRERIAQFYLVAVTTDDPDRIARLRNLNYRDSETKTLNEKEYPEEAGQKPTGYSGFISQDIQACLALADVYINNAGCERRKDLRVTAQQVCRYVSLMQHPGLVTPTNVERRMQAAFSAKVNSGCISRQVGAVVTDQELSVKAVGWNDVPKGQVPCLLRNVEHLASDRDEKAYSTYERDDPDFKIEISRPVSRISRSVGKGRNQAFCFKDAYKKVNGMKNQVHTRSLHAEENAFLQIAKNGGQGIEGGFLFSTASPCELCAKKAYQLGIEHIYYIDPYLGVSLRHVLASGDNRPGVTLFSGAIRRADHDLYEPIMSYKDELEKLSV